MGFSSHFRVQNVVECYSSAASTYRKKKGGGGNHITIPSSETNNQLKNDYVLSYLDQVTSVEELRLSRL